MQSKKLIRRAVGAAAVALALGAPVLHMNAHAHGSTGDTKRAANATTSTGVDVYLKARGNPA